MTFVLTLIGLIATWAAAAIVFVGVGLNLGVTIGTGRLNADRLIRSFWVGLCLTILFLQIWQLAFPISWHAAAALSGLSALGWIRRRRNVRDVVGRRCIDFKASAILAVGTAWAANLAMGPQTASDSGVYHQQIMRWVQLHRIIPGLANLHGRFAFNNASLLYAALLAVGPWHDRVEHVANGLLLVGLLFHIALAAQRAMRGGATYCTLFELVMVAPLTLMLCNSVFVSSLTTDTAATILSLVAAIYFHQMIATHDEASDTELFVTVVVISATMICQKASAAPFGGAVSSIAFVLWWLRTRTVTERRQGLTVAVVVALLLVGTWSLRSVILSGYVAYPATIGPMPVDWRVPREQATLESAWIAYSARWYYNEGLRFAGWAWLPGWGANTLRDPVARAEVAIPLLLALAVVTFHALRRRARHWRRQETLFLVGPTVLAIAVWFFTAPDPRFATALCWTLFATLATPLISAPTRVIARKWIAVIVGFFLVGVWPQMERAGSVSGLESKLFVTPGVDHGLHPMPVASLTSYTTTSGLLLTVPDKNNRCWDAPLPCTPTPAPNLYLRRNGDMESGFAVDGDWQAQSWPHPRFSDFPAFWKSTLNR